MGTDPVAAFEPMGTDPVQHRDGYAPRKPPFLYALHENGIRFHGFYGAHPISVLSRTKRSVPTVAFEPTGSVPVAGFWSNAQKMDDSIWTYGIISI